MKKIISITVLTSLTLLPLVGLAQFAPEAPPTITNVWSVLTTIRNWVFGLILTVAIFYFILGAFQFFSAAGDPAKLEIARRYVLYGVLGVLVAFLAAGLVQLVRQMVGA